MSYHHPFPANTPAIGIDLSPRGETRVTADQAVTTRRPVMSDATVIEQLDARDAGVVIHTPTTRPQGLPATVAVVLSGQQFVEGLVPLPADVALEVTDPTSRTFSRLAVIGDHDPDHALTATADLSVATKRWQLSTSAAPGFTVPWFQRGSSALAIGGLLAALPLGLFVRSIASRERVARDLVEIRTGELSAVNERLAQSNGEPPFEVRATAADDGAVEVRIRDHGPGIAPEDVERLFERFARGADRGTVPGTGLGLSIVRELADLNGGEVRYESAGPGACFVLRFERASLR